MAVRDDFSPGEVLTSSDLNDTFASKLDLAGGKILQIVRDTDATDRSTNSTSFVDVTGMSVTITPQKNDSAVLLVATFQVAPVNGSYVRAQITDSSNNAVPGAGDSYNGDNTSGFRQYTTLIGYATPATTSATTYKLRFRSNTSAVTVIIENATVLGQLFAIEVSA